MNTELKEILIGKFVDSEITPAEQRLLDDLLSKDPQAQAELAALLALRDRARTALAEIAAGGAAPETVFAQAWRQRPRRRWRPAVSKWLRVAAVLALGFLLGLLAHSWGGAGEPLDGGYVVSPPAVEAGGWTQAEARPERSVVAGPVEEVAEAAGPPHAETARRQASPAASRRYTYSDRSGNWWLIETERGNELAAVAYHGDL